MLTTWKLVSCATTVVVLGLTTLPRLVDSGSLPHAWSPPPGVFDADEGNVLVHLELLPGQSLVVWLADPTEPTVGFRLSGIYETTAVKFSDYHIQFSYKLESCSNKSSEHGITMLGCRPIESAQVTDLRLSDRGALSVTLHGECVNEHPGYQVCLHQQHGDRPVVVCSTLSDAGSRCTPSQPLDGRLINPPPDTPQNSDDRDGTEEPVR